jgi:hypothetical protein
MAVSGGAKNLVGGEVIDTRSAFRALVKWWAVSGLKRRKRGIGPNGRQGGMRGNVLCIVPSSHLAMKLQGFNRSNMGHTTARPKMLHGRHS